MRPATTAAVGTSAWGLPDPMPEPSRSARGRGSGRGGDRLQEPVVDGQREPLSGLAVGAIGEGPAAEMDDVLAGGVAVEDLEQEEVEGGGRVEDALPPLVPDLGAGLLDGLRRQ